MAGVPLTLSNTKPDFESLVLQLQLYLNAKATWSDLLTSSTGQTLIEMMSAVGAFNQFAVEVAAREGFLTSAVRDSSIYAITRMLGVRITRKLPAGADVSLSRAGDLTYPYLIPAFTQFSVNGANFFNRYPISWDAGKALCSPAKLFEGTVKTQTIAADSSAFREIFLNEPGFVVSTQDVSVVLTDPTTGISTAWSVIEEGIWTAGPADTVYYDATSGDGDTVLAFGDGYSGKLPSLGNNIVITYAVTSGATGNNGGSGLSISLSTNPSITGTTSSQITGGADEKPASYYKSTASYIYKARSRAVTPGDYKAIISDYPGVASVTVQAQKDIAPNDLRWMNVIRVCILPQVEDTFTQSEWDSFKAWFEKKKHAAIQVQQYNPIKIKADISVVLALKATAVPENVVPIAQTNIRALFARGVNTMGKRISISDIIEASLLTDVDYVQVVNPTSDLTTEYVKGAPNQLQYLELGALSVTAKYSERATN